MFFLWEHIAKIRIHPRNFCLARDVAVSNAIRERFCRKLIHDVGLCITLYDITAMGESAIHPGDGAVYIRTKFRLVVFRPFDGEILVGKIVACSKSRGIQVSLGFFDDILIPADLLQNPSVFDEDSQQWFWMFQGSGVFQYNVGDSIRFKVQSVMFRSLTHPPKPTSTVSPVALPSKSSSLSLTTTTTTTTPSSTTTPSTSSVSASTTTTTPTSSVVTTDDLLTPAVQPTEEKRLLVDETIPLEDLEIPMMIIGNVSLDGLGLPSWWR
nr:RNA polymerase III subunit RPC8 [Paratrimastix eleionoma]